MHTHACGPHNSEHEEIGTDKASKGPFKPGVVREALHIEFKLMLFQRHLAILAVKIKSYLVSCVILQERKQSVMASRLVLVYEGEPRLV